MEKETWALAGEPIPNRALEETSAWIVAMETSQTERDILRQVLRYAGRFGATHALAGTMPLAGQTGRQQIGHVLLNAWPNDWVLRYFSRDYLHDDPTIGMVREHHLPFLWKEIEVQRLQTKAARTVMDEARAFGLSDGFTLALQTIEGKTIGFSVAGERLEISDRERIDLRTVATYAVRRALRLKELDSVPLPKGITQREREALQLAADGWRDHEIAIRMGISHHGAEKHLRAVRDKLEARNTANALAIAMRLGLIR